MVLLGYEEGSKAYRLYDPKGGKVVISRDVVFNEMAAWDWEDPGTGEAGGVSGTFAVEHLVIQGGGDVGIEEQAADGPGPAAEATEEELPSSATAGVGKQSPPAVEHSPPPQSPTSAGPRTPLVEFASPPTDINEYMDAFHDGEEVRFHLVDNIVADRGAPGLANRLLDDSELLLVSTEEPPTFAVAESDANWRRAMLEEMKAIEDNRTWELVDPPVGCRPIGLKWVYKVKRDERDAIVKYKA
jgi:hypothetical protein